MKTYKSIAVVGKGAVGKSVVEQLEKLKNEAFLMYDELSVYDSKTIDSAKGTKPSLLIYAGVPGVKWQANQDPVSDAENCVLAFSTIRQIEADQTILISTIDAGFGEDSRYRSPYGQNRLALETLFEVHDDVKIVRLPALVGKNVVKNFWYDVSNPSTFNISFDMKSKLSKVIEALDLPYQLVPINTLTDIKQSIDYSVIDSNTQFEIPATEFNKAYATNPYSEFVWLDLDNFVKTMLDTIESTDFKTMTLTSKTSNGTSSMSAYQVYHEVTGKHMLKSIRSTYSTIAPRINYNRADLVNEVSCGSVSFRRDS